MKWDVIFAYWELAIASYLLGSPKCAAVVLLFSVTSTFCGRLPRVRR